MSALEQGIEPLGLIGADWVGLAAGGWMVACLVAVLAVRQAVLADRLGVRAAEAAHELRGPLCAARLALTGLERAFPDAPAVVRSIAAIDLELDRAGLALDELSGAGTGRRRRDAIPSSARREPVDLVALGRAAEPAWRALADARSTALELRMNRNPVWVLGDPRRLLQGIENMVANACEHGRGTVRVTVAKTGNVARVEVSDEGDGPSRAVIARARRRARRRGTLGSCASLRGHGMVVSARAAAEAGGSLSVRQTPTGTVVSLELPSDDPAGRRRERRTGRLASVSRRVGRGGMLRRRAAGRSTPLAGAQ